MIGDRQPVPLRRLEQVLARHAEVVEPQPVIVQMPQGQQSILHDLEVLVLVIGQVDDQDGGPVLDQADQADRPAGHGVSDEQLLAVDDVIIAVEHGPRLHGGQVGAGAGLGQGEGRELLAAGQQRQISLPSAPGVPKLRKGSTAPIQPWTDASPARFGSIVAIWVRKRENAANDAPCPPYCGSMSSPQYPAAPRSSSTASVTFPSGPKQGASVAMATCDLQRLAHRSLARPAKAAAAEARTGRPGHGGPRRPDESGC